MKKKLLYLTSILLFSALSINAQTTTWFLGSDAIWTTRLATGVASTTPVITVQYDKLNFTSHTTSVTNFAITATGNGTTFSDGYVATQRCATGGSGAPTGAMPTVRYFSFNVAGACTIKVWFRHGSTSGVDRNIFVTDGSTVMGTAAVAFSSNNIITANYTTTAGGPVYIYSDNGVGVYKIEVSGAAVNTPALSTNSFQKQSDVVIYAKDGKINLSNVTSATKVEVYTVLGALVKSAQADADTSLDINSGVYIVKAKSAEGEKSVKVIVQ
jgi:hypothetical protein